MKLKTKSLKDIKSYDREPSWDESLSPVVISKVYPNKNIKIRFCAPFTPVGVHYVCTKPSDMKLPFPERKGKSFPVWCPDFDSENEVFTGETCECCKPPLCEKGFLGKGKVYYYTQGFIESKDKKGRKTWGEMQCIVLDSGAISAIKNIYETSGNGIDPQDKKEGYAIWLKYENATKPVTWRASKAEDIRVKDIEGYSKDDLVDFSEYFKPNDPKEIKENLKRLGYYEYLKNNGEDDDDDNDFDDDDDEKSKKKKKVADDDDDDSDNDDDDDDEPKKKKKKKSDDDDDDDDEPKKKKKKKSDDDDDDDDSDNDDDDDDDDDEPKKKKKSDDDDDDDDNDDDDDSDNDDDDDDDDDEPKKKKKKKSDDDDDDDDDDEPKKKKKKKYDWDD